MVDEREQRRIYYDRDLGIEAYNLSGIVQKFPNHPHEYYVIGFVEDGRRYLCCKGQRYDVEVGDSLLFDPRDNHFCGPINGEVLDCRAVNVPVDVMSRAVLEIMGEELTPHFTQSMVKQSETAQPVGVLHDVILDNEPGLKREEAFPFLLEQVLWECATPFEDAAVTSPDERIQMLCDYMEEYYVENVSLDELPSMTSSGKSHLLRVFTEQTGVLPYRYLQNVGLDRAERLLEQGVAPVDAAVTTGFSDQGHFSNFFKEFIGLTPKQCQRIFKEDTEVDRRGPGETMEDGMDGEAKHE